MCLDGGGKLSEPIVGNKICEGQPGDSSISKQTWPNLAIGSSYDKLENPTSTDWILWVKLKKSGSFVRCDKMGCKEVSLK